MKNKLIIECLSAAILLSACSVLPHDQTNIKNEEITVSSTPAEMTIIPVSTQIPVMPDTTVQTIAPTPEPESELLQYIPTPTPIATQEPGLAVIITKNPTSEALNVGGKTWFIAHAENAVSLTWQMVDLQGNVHSIEETMNIMPGLVLEALEGDTIAVSDVPAALNGWGVIARFDGRGNSVTTDPAYIYVGDFINSYGNIIEKYRYGKEAANASGQNAMQYGVSEQVGYYENVGYALKDLDKNGLPELVIAGINSKSQYPMAEPIFAIYTLSNNVPVEICTSYSRVRFYLLRDNRILYEASGGAADTLVELFNVNGQSLQFVEGYRTVNDYDLMGSTAYYSSVWNGEIGPFTIHGDYNNPDFSIPSENLFPYIQGMEAKTWIPYLTKIV